MRALLLSFLALAAPAAAQTCVVTDIATTDFGTECGFFGGAHLDLAWNAVDCALDVDLDAPACCNTFVVEHWFAYGFQAQTPQPLGPPFLADCALQILPFQVIGPFPGTSAQLKVPSSSALLGLVLETQAFPVYFTTIGLTYDYAATQRVQLLFL